MSREMEGKLYCTSEKQLASCTALPSRKAAKELHCPSRTQARCWPGKSMEKTILGRKLPCHNPSIPKNRIATSSMCERRKSKREKRSNLTPVTKPEKYLLALQLNTLYRSRKNTCLVEQFDKHQRGVLAQWKHVKESENQCLPEFGV